MYHEIVCIFEYSSIDTIKIVLIVSWINDLDGIYRAVFEYTYDLDRIYPVYSSSMRSWSYVTHTILIVCYTYHLDRIYRAVFEWKSYVYIVSFINSFAKETYNVDRRYRAVFEWKCRMYSSSFEELLWSHVLRNIVSFTGLFCKRDLYFHPIRIHTIFELLWSFVFTRIHGMCSRCIRVNTNDHRS